MRPGAIVLAGGASRRFGGDKLAALHGDLPVLQHAARAVGTLADPVVLVLAPDAPVPPMPGGVAGRVVVARDPLAYEGPLAGLDAGLRALPHPCPVALVVAGDMPSLVPAVLGLLVAALAGDERLAMVTLEADPSAPLPAAVRPDRVGPAAAALLAEGRRSLRALGDAVPSMVLPAASWRVLDWDGLTLRDVDRPEDLPAG